MAEGGGARPNAVHDFNHLLEDGHHLPVVFGAAVHVRAFPLLTYQRDDLLELLFLRLCAFVGCRVRVAVDNTKTKKPLVRVDNMRQAVRPLFSPNRGLKNTRL